MESIRVDLIEKDSMLEFMDNWALNHLSKIVIGKYIPATTILMIR